MKTLSMISGIGLGILWLISLGNPAAATWLTWLDGVGALLSFIVAGVMRAPGVGGGGPVSVAVGLFALWLIGLSTNGAPFQNWWTFIFACVMGIAAIVGSYEGRGRRGVPTTEEDRFRKTA